ncbi:MAG: DUF4058 family protein [Gemmataceae bacterium]|nr:DUF4058 family protein [Gemmataceae bacterium]
MPIHDWTRVEAGIFHAFHHDWITEIARALNRGLLPADYYALPEQHAAGFGPDVLTLQDDDSTVNGTTNVAPPPASGPGGVLLAAPKLPPSAETDMAFYRRKQKVIAVRHVSGDRIVAMVEIVSPSNKAARNPLRAFVAKAAQLLDQQIHLLILDLLPRGRRDPDGIHGEIWQEIAGQEYTPPADKPLTLAAYESGLTVRAYVVLAAVGDVLTEMPLFLEPEQAVHVPLEATYMAAFNEVPRRWRRVLEPSTA